MNKKITATLFIIFFAIQVSFSQQAYDKIFFTEYFEGSGNQNALEIGNYSGADIPLKRLRISTYFNGTTELKPFAIFKGWKADDGTTTSIPSGSVFVVYNNKVSDKLANINVDTDLPNAPANKRKGISGGAVGFSGNDAVTLEYDTDGNGNWIIVDIIGVIGEDPGKKWGKSVSTQDRSISRKPTIQKGVQSNPGAFDPADEWISNYNNRLPKSPFTTLGVHELE